MKIKKILPVLAIAAFSCLITAGLTIFVFFTTMHPDPIVKFHKAFQISAMLGGVSFVPLLLGVGLNGLLARIQNISRRRVISLLLYLGATFTFMVLPAVLTAVTSIVFSNRQGWQELRPMPEFAVQIAGAGKDTVIARSISGNYYSCQIRQVSRCWQYTTKPYGMVIQDSDVEVEAINYPPQLTPPFPIIDVVGITYTQSSVVYQLHYVVAADGRVWYLKRLTINNNSP